MELTLSLDAGAGPVVAADAKAPGTDPNDATSVAFASLLASLVAATAPTPDVTVPAAPDAATTEAAAVAAGVALAVPAPAFGAPIALPAAPAPEPKPAVDVAPEEATPEEAHLAEPELAPTLFALPEPTARAIAGPAAEVEPDLDPEAGLDIDGGLDPEAGEAEATAAPAPRHRAAEPVRPTAVQSPEAVAAMAGSGAQPSAATIEAEAPAATRPAADPLASVTHPSAQAPAAPVREILKPEIVSGPGAARPSSPVEQVVKAVAPLRRLADGTHNVVLELHPAELGAVRVELSLDRGIVHLGLRADVEGTGQLLRAALPELRSQLDAAGLTSGRVSVDAGQAGPRGEGQPAWRTDPDRTRRRPLADDAELVEELVPSAYSTSDYGHVDVRL